MKQLLIALICCCAAASLQAQDYGLYWKYKDYDGAIALSLPRWVIHAGSWFLDEKEDRQMLRKIRKARILVFEDGSSPVTNGDMERFTRKAQKRGLEHMLSIREGKTRLEIWAKERRNKLRKVVVLAREPDSFALVSLRTRIDLDELAKLLNELWKEGEKSNGEPLLPQNVRPVIRL